MIRNPNPTRIQENNESCSRTRNPSLTTVHDVARNSKNEFGFVPYPKYF